MADTHEFAIYFEDLTEKVTADTRRHTGPYLYELGRVPRGNYQPR